ncbi:hypothetical protein ACA910_013470 [Epithemia clementina (nom. ined.)]
MEPVTNKIPHNMRSDVGDVNKMIRRLPVKIVENDQNDQEISPSIVVVDSRAAAQEGEATQAATNDTHRPTKNGLQEEASEKDEEERPSKWAKGSRANKKKNPTKWCCAIGCGKSEFETSFRRVPMIPQPLPPDASEGRRKTFNSRLARRRELLCRLGLGGEDGRKDLRYCVSHDRTWTMKAYSVKNGDLTTLREKEIDKPLPPTGHELLIRVKAVATNAIDIKHLENPGSLNDQIDNASPHVLGRDAAGVVEEVGPHARLFRQGDEVMFAVQAGGGAFAEYVSVDERLVGPKPSSFAWSQAASVPLSFATAWEALFDKLNVPVEEDIIHNKTILIVGGAGGVATAAIDLSKNLFGLTVIATGSHPESVEYVTRLGAAHVLNHHHPLAPQLNICGMDKVDYILHCVDLTTASFHQIVSLVKPFGAICCVWPSDTVVDMMQLFWKSINFSIVSLRKRVESERQHEILTQLSKLLDDGVLSCKEHRTFPISIENIRKALELHLSGQCVGKTTLYFENSASNSPQT